MNFIGRFSLKPEGTHAHGKGRVDRLMTNVRLRYPQQPLSVQQEAQQQGLKTS